MLQCQGDVRHLLQLVLVLGDEHAVVQGFIGRELCVRMSADDQIEPRIGLGQFEVSFVADVR